jgi:hypothetical protein
VFLNFRNNLVMMAKNMPAGEAFWKITYRFVLDSISAVKSLLAGEGKYFVAVFRAHFAFLGWWLSGRKRNAGLPKRGVKLHGYLGRSVVWAHFVGGKKTFSEIVNRKS